MPDKLTVGVVGLGIMGSAFAKNMLQAGYRVFGYDIAEEAVMAFEAIGGHACSSCLSVATACDVILLSLASVEALETAVLGEAGLQLGLRPGTIICEMGTLPLQCKEKIRDAVSEVGAVLLDCPVSGTGAQAIARDLVIYASGDEPSAQKVQPVFETFARDTRYVGPFGSGTMLKFVANLLVTVHNLAAAEALLLAQRSGLDLSMVLEAVSAGAGNSRMLEVRGPMMIEGRYEPPTMKFDVYMKDLSLILDHACDVRCPTPLLSASLPYYTAALTQGRDKQDTAALFAVLQTWSTLA